MARLSGFEGWTLHNIVARCEWVHPFCTPEGERAPKFCCNLQTLLRRSLHSLISRRTVIVFVWYLVQKNVFTVPSNPQMFRTKCVGNGPTVGTIEVMFTCKQKRMYNSRDTCLFLSHYVIGSRPINLHNLLPRYVTGDLKSDVSCLMDCALLYHQHLRALVCKSALKRTLRFILSPQLQVVNQYI